MAQAFAKDQPAGFVNQIERVAIVGAGGQVGRRIAEAIMKTGKHQLTAISRVGSKSPLPEGIKVASVDYSNEETLVEALKGQQFLIITMATMAPPDTQDKLIKAAAKAGVRWIMPNGYGNDPRNEKYITENFTGRPLLAGIKAVEDTNSASWVVLSCQHWYEYSLTVGDWAYGFDYKNKKVTFYDDGKSLVTTTTWVQCGRAMAALLSLPVLPQDESDKSLTLSHYRNNVVYIASFQVSQRDMLDSVEKATGTTDNDWKIEYENSSERWERGKKLMSVKDKTGFRLAMYARGHFPDGDTNFVQEKLDNEKLGLPKEDFDEATKRAVGMWKSGYDAMARHN